MNSTSRDSLRQGIEDVSRRLDHLERQVLAMEEEDAENPTEGEAKAPAAAPRPRPPPPAGQTTRAPGPEPTPSPGEQNAHRWLNDEVRASLAFFVVFFIIFSLILAWFFLGIEEAVRASALLLPLVTLVLGYYFGSKGQTAAQKQATVAGEQARDAIAARDQADHRRRKVESASFLLSAELQPEVEARLREINRELGLPEDSM